MAAGGNSLYDEVGALAHASSLLLLGSGRSRTAAVQMTCQRPEHLIVMLGQSSWNLLDNILDLLDDQLLTRLQANWSLLVDQISLSLESYSAQAQQHT